MALASTLLALAVGEGALRMLYPTLPSLAPLSRSSYELRPFEWSDWPRNNGYADTRDTCRQGVYLRPDPAQLDAAQEEAAGAELWVVGDSMSVGVGLPPGSSYASLLQRDLSQALGEPVRLRNLASPGANFCTILHILDESLARLPAPDAVIVQFYADDLHGRDRVAVGDELVMFPDWVADPTLRWLVERSYVANLVWYLISPSRHALPPRIIDPGARRLFTDSMIALSAQAKAQGFELIVTLFAPTGLHLCPDPPPTDSRCMWMGADMNTIADILGDAGIDFVDLRRFWEDKPVMVLPIELEKLKEGKMTMGVHPDGPGHRALADALMPRVRAAIEGR